MPWVIEHSYLIPLLPLIGAAVAGLFGARVLKGQSHWPIWLAVLASAVMSTALVYGMYTAVEVPGWKPVTTDFFTWISAGSFKATAGFFFDPLTAVMLCVVTWIGFLISVYSAGYMKGEDGYWRFFAYIGLFIFMMTVLVMGNNFVLLYLGWEGVGLCSYLLIGYYYERPAAREAAKKAFIVNRVGDFGFGIGIMLTFLVFGTISYFGGDTASTAGVLERVLDASFLQTLPAWKQNLIPWIPFCLMLGAFGKSAQFPLYVWLPDAMEGPSPVSALIHAATMVTAGVYMIARCSALFVASESALLTVAIIGGATALFAATIALRQFDLKKVFAYSTVSQLGFMFVGVGMLAPVAGVFHLVTHAFFKALLFLSCGVVMHAMFGQLDMRKMSGLKRVLPITRILMLIGCAALAGLPFLSGFFSKDEIVAAAWDQHRWLGVVMLFTAFLTAYYTFRLYFRVFEGPLVMPEPPADAQAHDSAHGHGSAHGHDDAHASGHDEKTHHSHEPPLMILPLVVLAIGALLAGYLNCPSGGKDDLGQLARFLGHSPSLVGGYNAASARHGGEIETAAWGQPQTRNPHEVEALHEMHKWMMIISGLVAVLGVYLAYLMHLRYREAPQKLARRYPGITRMLEAKYWVDEIYQAGIIEPLRRLGRALAWCDQWIIDSVVWLVAFVPRLAGYSLRLSTQRGYLQGYALTMLLGVLVVLLWILAKA